MNDMDGNSIIKKLVEAKTSTYLEAEEKAIYSELVFLP